jgi:hypothetical protein
MELSVITSRLPPWYLVGAYRLVPGRIRGMRFWPGSQKPSSSHMALYWMDQGMNGWTAIGPDAGRRARLKPGRSTDDRP